MKKVMSVCPYCGAGCKLKLVIDNNKITRAGVADGVTSQNQLCLKGHYGWDSLNDTQLLTPRLKQPVVRYQKGGAFTPVSWQEMIRYIASKLRKIKEKHGPRTIMTTGSSHGTGNETNYVIQKFVRAVLNTNNVDYCARVYHGPSVAGLQQALGNGTMSNSISDVKNSKCLLVFGYNCADFHPIATRRVIKARENGAKIIVCDPRRIETVRIADRHLQLSSGSNTALVNAFGYILLEEELYNKAYAGRYTEGLDAYREAVRGYTSEAVEAIVGINTQAIRETMRILAAAPSATIMQGMDVTQFGQAVDVVRGPAGLALPIGNPGRANVGVGPVHGQNNVQGACGMGVLPNLFPGYQEVTDPAVRGKFAAARGVDPALMDDQVSTRITEVPHKALTDEIKAYYIMGEDPLQTEADLGLVRKGIEALDFVVVQDIFMIETAEIADVLLPATSWGEHGGVFTCADRGFQRFEQTIPPAGNVKRDWKIISLLVSEMGYPMHYENNQQIWNKIRELYLLFYDVTWEKMGDMGYVQQPCPTLDHLGTPWLYKGGRFDIPSGKGQLFVIAWRVPAERPDDEWPLVFCTVREVGHYSCHSMTGNCAALQPLTDEPERVQMSPLDAQRLGIADKQLVWISSRRGKMVTRADLSDRINPGAVYMTYQWWVGACNELTQDNLDPISKTSETKYCAVRMEAIVDQQWAERYAWAAYSDMKA